MTAIDICNQALMMLGVPTITSFDDPGENARRCKLIFPSQRDLVLRDHTWSFATASIALSQVAEECFDGDYSCICALPVDLIRIIALESGGELRRVGSNIFVKSLPDTLVYIRRVEDCGKFDITFCEALQYRMAAKLCVVNTRSPGEFNSYMQEYQRTLGIARSIDSAENVDAYQRHPRSSFLAARGAGEYYRPIKTTSGDSGVQ